MFRGAVFSGHGVVLFSVTVKRHDQLNVSMFIS